MDRLSPDIHDCPRFALELMTAVAVVITVSVIFLLS